MSLSGFLFWHKNLEVLADAHRTQYLPEVGGPKRKHYKKLGRLGESLAQLTSYLKKGL